MVMQGMSEGVLSRCRGMSEGVLWRCRTDQRVCCGDAVHVSQRVCCCDAGQIRGCVVVTQRMSEGVLL